jgi:hypothetical protein
MSGVEDMIKQADRSKNKPTVGTPNEITEWYAERNGKMFLNELWCNMGITFWAFHSGNHMAVCFGTDFAATQFHSQRFKDEGQWQNGASGIRRGDIVFFTRPDVVGIGHIGLVHTVTSSDLVTIEANTSDAVRFRTHPLSSGDIVGYGRPDYAMEDDMTKDELEKVIDTKLSPGFDSAFDWAKQLNEIRQSVEVIRRDVDEIKRNQK